MNILISKPKAQTVLRKLLIGCNVDSICYNITGWTIRFISPVFSSEGAHFHLSASEITMENTKDWWKHLDNLPVNLQDTNEAKDTIVAINLFTVINSHSLTKLSTDKIGNLHLGFGNGCEICIKAIIPSVDWTWDIADEKKEQVILYDSGALFGSSKYFQK